MHGDRLEIRLDPKALAERIGAGQHHTDRTPMVLNAPYRLTRSGNTLRLIQGDGARISASPDAALVRLIILARQWWAELARGDSDVTTLAARAGYTPSYVTRVLRLAFLSPRIVEAVVSGRQHSQLSPATVRSSAELPSAWGDQEAMFLAG